MGRNQIAHSAGIRADNAVLSPFFDRTVFHDGCPVQGMPL